jgi:hypothetical protein
MPNEDEEVITKHHKKIFVGKIVEYESDMINNTIGVLLKAAIENNDEAVVRQMKRIIPEYISNNSVYESFDDIDQNQVITSD